MSKLLRPPTLLSSLILRKLREKSNSANPFVTKDYHEVITTKQS